jgi:hypothetical protein
MTGNRQIFAVLIAGLLLRLIVANTFWGSRDVTLQIHHAQMILGGMSAWTSKLPIAYFAPAAMEALSYRTGIAANVTQKFPAIAADLLCAILLWNVARRRGQARPWVWPAVYLLNPATIILSAYHGNIDPAMATAMFWALTLRWREKPVAAGVALGIALAMKPTALLAFPVLLLPLSRRGNIPLAVAAVATLGAICAPFALTDPTFGRFLADYGGPYGNWGFPLIFKQLENVSRQLFSLGGPALDALHALNAGFASYGRYLLAGILGSVLLLLALKWKIATARENARAMAAMFLLFYVFASGFGSQYLSLVIPFLLMTSTRLTVIYSAVLTPYLVGTYAQNALTDGRGGVPITDHLGLLSRGELALLVFTGIMSIAAWVMCAWVVWRLTASDREADWEHRASDPQITAAMP